MRPVPWERIIRYAVMGTVLIALVVLFDVDRTGRNVVNIIQPGAAGPSADVIHRDFPAVELPSGLGLDGQQYYAMARDPVHLDVAARSLDRPAYRWQRPLFPWLARALHPQGAGDGLILAFVVVGLLGLVIGGVAAGALSHALGGRSWPAFVFPLLPGAYESLRVTVADALAVALALAAIAVAARTMSAARHRARWHGLAITLGAAATLTKETAVVLLVGWALARRDRRSVVMAGVAVAVAGMWAVWLRLVLPTGGSGSVDELGLPFAGLVRAAHAHWLAGTNRFGMVSTIGALVIGIAALWRVRLRHPLGPAIALNLAFVSLMNHNVLGLDFGGTRATLPLLAVALIALAAPAGQPTRVDTAAPEHAAAGIDGPRVAVGGSTKR